MKNKKKVENYIFSYEKDDKTYFQLYICKRSKLYPSIKKQKRINDIESLKEAKKLKERWIELLVEQIKEREAKGYTWGQVVEFWEAYWKSTPTRKFNDYTLKDHVSRATYYTSDWWELPASTISPAHAQSAINKAFKAGASVAVRKAIKGTVNQIFKWGVRHRKIVNNPISPMIDVELLGVGEAKPDETRKEILNWSEICTLLKTARSKKHEWFPIWFFDLHTGMRTSEIEALSKRNIELVPVSLAKKLDKLPDGDERKNYGYIHVEWSWKPRAKSYGPTKGHWWRQVPINQELYWFLVEYLKNDFGENYYPPTKQNPNGFKASRVFPQLPYWRRGEQAKVLRLFCEANELKSIKFHTLRACWATQLLGMGVPEDKVMKAGGWKDVDTMRIYVRQSGIDERATTQGLKFNNKKESYDPNSAYNHVDYRSAQLMDFDDEEESTESPILTVVEEKTPIQGNNIFNLNEFRGSIGG